MDYTVVKQGSHLRPGQQADIPDDLWERKEHFHWFSRDALLGKGGS